MNNNFNRWLAALITLMIIMSLSSFFSLLIKPIIFILKQVLSTFMLLIFCFRALKLVRLLAVQSSLDYGLNIDLISTNINSLSQSSRHEE